MNLFWQTGYRATSMQMLVDVTGLNRSSLYNTFGTKDALFLSSVERYLEKINRVRLQKMKSNDSPRKGIEVFFNDVIDFATGDGKKLGCLLTNSAIELGNVEGKIQQRLYGVFKTVEDEFTAVIKRGQQSGGIATTQKARTTARFLVTQLQGLRVMSRVNPKKDWLRSSLILAMGVLDNKAKVA